MYKRKARCVICNSKKLKIINTELIDLFIIYNYKCKRCHNEGTNIMPLDLNDMIIR